MMTTTRTPIAIPGYDADVLVYTDGWCTIRAGEADGRRLADDLTARDAFYRAVETAIGATFVPVAESDWGDLGGPRGHWWTQVELSGPVPACAVARRALPEDTEDALG